MGDNQETITVAKVKSEETGNIYTWMYIALIIIIIISGYNMYYNWQNSYNNLVMSGGQVLAWVGNLILFFGSIIGLFLVYNRSISCQSSLDILRWPGTQVKTGGQGLGGNKRTVY